MKQIIMVIIYQYKTMVRKNEILNITNKLGDMYTLL